MGACEDRNGAATWWASACVVTNYGCRGCRGLCRGCTAEGAVRVQETDEETVLESVRLLSPYLGSLAVGGCDPLYVADGDRVRFLSGLFREMLFPANSLYGLKIPVHVRINRIKISNTVIRYDFQSFCCIHTAIHRYHCCIAVLFHKNRGRREIHAASC